MSCTVHAFQSDDLPCTEDTICVQHIKYTSHLSIKLQHNASSKPSMPCHFQCLQSYPAVEVLCLLADALNRT